MPENKSSLFCDEYELPINRKKRILSDLEDIENQEVVLLSSVKNEKKEKKKESDEDKFDKPDEWITSLSTISTSRIKATKSAKDLFSGKKKKKEKKKKKDELTDFHKEFEPEIALVNNLLAEQIRFTDSLQQKYDRMENTKSSARGTGKFTTDLISSITSARQLSAHLIDKKIATKKAIYELEMKERKDKNGGVDGEDMNNFAAKFLGDMLAANPNMSTAFGGYEIEDVDDAGMMGAIDSSIDDERGEEVSAYLKYENRNIQIKIEMNPDDSDDYDFYAETDDGEAIFDYPLPEHTKLTFNRSTMIATDAYGKKYPVFFREG